MSSTVQGLAVKQQMDSVARQLDNFRAQKDLVIVAAPLEETATESARNHELIRPAQTARTVPPDTSIKQVFSGTSSDTLSKGTKHMLDGLAETLKSNRKSKAELTGFSSRDGLKAFNRDLAMRRMSNVRAYLLKEGIHTSQMSTLSYGTDKCSEMDMYAHRVEVYVSL